MRDAVMKYESMGWANIINGHESYFYVEYFHEATWLNLEEEVSIKTKKE
jgi:hypothetical protein